MSKTPLFLPSPTSSNPSTPGGPLEIISVTSSSDSPPPPPRRSPRKTKKRRRQPQQQLMAHVLIPPLPRGARKSDYVPVEERLRKRKRQNADKGKARAGDNSGSTALVHALQGAFENNWGTKKIPTPLDQALSAAFTHNSANPKVAATSSGNTRRRAETVSDSAASVELMIPSSTRACEKGKTPSAHVEQSTQETTARSQG
jgi:hypothetical protein